MRLQKLFLYALISILISLAAASTSAQTKLPERYLHERGVNRVHKIDAGLFALDQIAADNARAADKQRPGISGRMKLDLFPDFSVTVNLDRIEQQGNNHVAWHGKVDGAPLGRATFLLSGNDLIGSVTRGDGKIYRVETDTDGNRWAIEIDQARLPDESDPVILGRSEQPRGPVVQQDVMTSADDGSTIDVMVVYTPAARLAAGSTALMEQRIQLGIAETNQGYADSGVIQRVRLVAARELNYTESPMIATDLTRMVTPNDGFLEEVPTLRNTFGADLVSLWVNTTENTCGIGYQMVAVSASFAPYGHTVAQLDCATGYYTFGHEMGHNMGATHGRDDVDSRGEPPQGAYPYAYGYKKTTGTRFRTIMAYDANCSCTRINRWSNPDSQFNGSPTGIDPNSPTGAANYLVLNNTRTIVANFRAAVLDPPPPLDSTGPQLTITSHANNQTVIGTTITISGTATDSGRGDNGISSVTVNGIRASGDTATGTGAANWTRTFMLNSGANNITVVAKDNSSPQNSTTLSIVINSAATSSTSMTYHVFPQFADGRFFDGTYYRTTLMISNPSSTLASTCTLQLRGFTVPGFALTYDVPASGSVIESTSGTQAFRSGYATLQCSTRVEAQLLYSYYAAGGAKISEATVFSSPPASVVRVVADETSGAQVGLAITNDSDQSATYSISVTNTTATSTVTLSPRSSTAKFLRELVPGIPENNLGLVTVSSGSIPASIIGLRYTGGVFSTLPQSPFGTMGPTASTYHVFPQFADGRFSDGTFYRTTQMYLNPNSSVTTTCDARLRAVTTDGASAFTAIMAPGDGYVAPTNGTQIFQSGFATVQCSGGSVDAQVLYSYYGPDGRKRSEATVFSSPSAPRVQILADEREGSQVGLAIANDSNQTVTYTIAVTNASGSATVTLLPQTSTAKFLRQFIPGYACQLRGTGCRFSQQWYRQRHRSPVYRRHIHDYSPDCSVRII